jgi:hypothetical protein
VLQKREMKLQTLPTNCFVDYSDNGVQENWFYNDQILEVGGAEGGSISEDTAITECAETCDSTGICPISSNRETAPSSIGREREREKRNRIIRLTWLGGCVSFLVYIWPPADGWFCPEVHFHRSFFKCAFSSVFFEKLLAIFLY